MTYVLVKSAGYATTGTPLSAVAAAERLLVVAMWPMWEHTRCRRQIAPGDYVAVYVTGGSIVATARVEQISSWSRLAARSYPLLLDGTPSLVLYLGHIRRLEPAIDVRTRLASLSFVKPGTRKWGTAFIGGARPVNADDYRALTEPEANTRRTA